MPNPVITRTSKRRYPSGLLNKTVVTTSDITKVYSLAQGSEFAEVTLRVMNTSNHATSIKLWVAPSNALPTLVDTIEPNITLQANEVYITTGLAVSYNESIYIQSTQTPVVVRIEGLENVIT